MMSSGDLYGIEPRDRTAANELLDWWTRQSAVHSDAAREPREPVLVCIATPPDGWNPGWCLPMIVDGSHPYVWEVVVHGAGETQSTVSISWEGHQIEWSTEATASMVWDALPATLRPFVQVYGGAVEDLEAGRTRRLRRWSLAFRLPVTGLAAPVSQTVPHTIVQRTPFVVGQNLIPYWTPAAGGMSPDHAAGTLAMGWWGSRGLMVGIVEPRTSVEYVEALQQPTTTSGPTTTAAPTTSTTPPPTTSTTTTSTSTTLPPPTTIPPSTPPPTIPPPTTTTSSTTEEPTTTTTAGPTTTSTSTTDGPTTTTTSTSTTSTTPEPEEPTTTTAGPTTTTSTTSTTPAPTTPGPTTQPPVQTTVPPTTTTTTTSTTVAPTTEAPTLPP